MKNSFLLIAFMLTICFAILATCSKTQKDSFISNIGHITGKHTPLFKADDCVERDDSDKNLESWETPAHFQLLIMKVGNTHYLTCYIDHTHLGEMYYGCSSSDFESIDARYFKVKCARLMSEEEYFKKGGT